MKKAALFFDIDGTIFDEKNKRIPKSAIKRHFWSAEKGHLLFINTGELCFARFGTVKAVHV